MNKAFVINLDERSDRWEWMKSQLRLAGIVAERFPAVTPKDLSDNPPPLALREFLLRVDGLGPGFERKLWGTWACMQSHLAVLRLASEQGLSSVLILEDDCQFELFAKAVLKRIQLQRPMEFLDVLFLGGTLKKGGEYSKLTENIYSVSRVRLAHAYWVNQSVYARILSEASCSGLPLDWYYSEKLLPEINSGIVSPVVAYQRINDVSSIEGVARAKKFRSRLFFRRLYCRIRYLFG